jgi:hypothetical protein
VIFCVLDELGHWRAEGSANPAEDVYQSIKPAMVTIPNSLLIGISSPHARTGLLYRKYQELWGKAPGRSIFVKAPTWTMNPNVATARRSVCQPSSPRSRNFQPCS